MAPVWVYVQEHLVLGSDIDNCTALHTIFTVLSLLLQYCIFPRCKLNLCFSLQENIYAECV
jgi:hypothetical protein